MTHDLAIALENVRLYGLHGVGAQERAVGAEFRLDVSVTLPRPDGCMTDEIDDTVSYADIYEVVREEFSHPSRLIEHVAHRIGTKLLACFPVLQTVEVKVVKIAPPIPGFSGHASVRLFFEKNDSKNLAE